MRQKIAPIVRLHRRAIVQQHSVPGLEKPCFIYPFSLNSGGYGGIKVAGKTCMAHIVAFEALVGPVPAGLELDHLCRVRPCIEVTHLEPVTHRENDLRGASPAIRRHLTGVCVRGHRFAPGTQCATCTNDAQREAYQALRRAGHTAAEAYRLRGTTAARRFAGWNDERSTPWVS